MRRPLLAALIVALIVVLPALSQGALVGSPGAETLGHAWVRWWSAAAWPDAPLGTDLASGADRWPVIDPLPTWLFGGVAQVLGDTGAWNASVFCAVGVTALGGAAFVRAMGGPAVFGALAVPLMPIYLGSLASGLTEDHFLGFVAFALAFALQRSWIVGALFVGVAAWCGLYLGWMAGLGYGVLAALDLLRQGGGLGRPSGADQADAPPTARGIRGLVAPLAGVGLAALLAGSAGLPFASTLGADAPVLRPAPPEYEPAWKLNPWRGADVASFVAPGKVEVDGAALREHPVYLGITTLGLAVVGGASPAWLAVGACAAASLGDDVVVAGRPADLGNPAVRLLRALPLGDRFRNHARLMLLGQLVLVGLAGRGVKRLIDLLQPRVSGEVATRFQRGNWMGTAIGLVVATEVLLASPARVPLPSTPSGVPPIYAAIPPSDLPMRVLGSQNPQAPLFHQRWHGHRLVNDPNRPPAMPEPGRLEIVVAFGDLATMLPGTLGPPDATAEDAAAWWP